MEKNYFSVLNAINVNDKVEKKNNLTYLSWAWAWGEVKKLHPDATYTIYENASGAFYHTDGHTCWVKTGVTVEGIEHIEYLPVMDNRNNSIMLERVTSFDVNKAIQRSLTKACARHGLGLYIYAGEDLPEGDAPAPTICSVCGTQIVDSVKRNGTPWSASEIVSYGLKQFNRILCPACQRAAHESLKAAKAEAEKQQEAFDTALSESLESAK